MILTQDQINDLREHTPGPWTVEMTNNYMRLYMPELGPGGDVARGYVGRQNALLMAAGPDLLDTLDARQREIDRLSEIAAGADNGGHWYSQQTMDAVARERDDLRADQTASPNEETAKLRTLVADYRLLLQNLYEQAEDRNGTESGAISVLLHQVNAVTKTK